MGVVLVYRKHFDASCGQKYSLVTKPGKSASMMTRVQLKFCEDPPTWLIKNDVECY